MNKCQICAFFMFYQIIPYEYFRAHLTFVANISSALCICKMVSYARMVRWWIDLMLLFASSIRFKKTLLTVKLHFRQYTWQRTCVNIDIKRMKRVTNAIYNLWMHWKTILCHISLVNFNSTIHIHNVFHIFSNRNTNIIFLKKKNCHFFHISFRNDSFCSSTYLRMQFHVSTASQCFQNHMSIK